MSCPAAASGGTEHPDNNKENPDMITQYSSPCWRLTDATGADHDYDDGPCHFDSADEATEWAREVDLNPQYTPRQYPTGCVTVACSGCHEELDLGQVFASVHFPNVDVAKAQAKECDFVVVGDDVWCEDCKTDPHPPIPDEHGWCRRCGDLVDDHKPEAVTR